MRVGLVTSSSLSASDPVAADVLGMYAALLERGDDPVLFTSTGQSASAVPVLHIRDAAILFEDERDLLIYHLSQGDDGTIREVRKLPCRVIVKYHGILTPVQLGFADAGLARAAKRGRETLAELADLSLAGFICATGANRDELVAAGVQASRIVLVPPFTRASTLLQKPPAPATLDILSRRTFNLLCVGRVLPHRKLENIVRTFAMALERRDLDVHLHIVGSHDEPRIQGYIDLLGTMVAEGLAPFVSMYGHVDEASLATFYRGCDLFWAAEVQEGFPTACLEAMAFGLPILASAEGPFAEVCGEAAIVADVGAPQADELVRLLEDDAGRHARGRAGRKRFEARFGSAAVARDVLAALAALDQPVETAEIEGDWFGLPGVASLVAAARDLEAPEALDLHGRDARADFVDWVLRHGWTRSNAIAAVLRSAEFVRWAGEVGVPDPARHLPVRQRLIWRFHRFANARFDLGDARSVGAFAAWCDRQARDLYALPGPEEAQSVAGAKPSRVTSYAQNFEDVMLWRALKDVPEGRYIDIGANHPEVDSVTRLFYEHGWSGINVEPVQDFYDELVKQRPRDTNLRLGVGAVPQATDFFLVGLETVGSGMSTSNEALAREHAARGHSVRRERIEVDTLAEICRRHVTGEVHFLKVDVEGDEASVLQGADFSKVRPWIVVVEAMAPNGKDDLTGHWDGYLTQADYLGVWFDGLNRFYVAREHHARLAHHFQSPPNVFDGFQLWDGGVGQANADAQAELKLAREENGRLHAIIEARRLAAEPSPDLPMDAEAFVAALYPALLGRPADPDGLTLWSTVLTETGDPRRVVAGLVGSAEYAGRSTSRDRVPDGRAAAALAMLGRRPRIVDVGAQSLGDGTHPYSPLAAFTPVDIVGFDPLDERLEERRVSEGAQGSLTLLPYAIADGASHELHVNDDDATSSLYPLNTAHNASFNHLKDLRTVRVEAIETRRLDDVLDDVPVDYLKIDVQGSELMVLEGATRVLAATACVHCEVEFAPIYAGQPLFPEIMARLTESGFYLVDLLTETRYHYADTGIAGPDRLLWADAVFFRTTDDPQTLAAQALVAAAIYGKSSLADHLVSRSRAAATTSPANEATPPVRDATLAGA